MELEAGAEVAGRYKVVRWLARGGFAEVYLVEHLHLQTRHALKVLRNADPTLRARLVDEGRIQAQLRHPHIVRVTDLVDLTGPAGGLGLVMDLVDGPSLTDHLHHGPPPVLAAWTLGTQILEGVAAAHALGLVHRDLKPDNVLLERMEDGTLRPRITDFGLARARLTGTGPRHTQAGLGMGTPAYMAPEQFQDAASVDQRADVFSLGAILFELLTGRRAFDAQGPAALFRQVSLGDRPSIEALLPDLPMGMVEAIESALEPDRTMRAASCAELLSMWQLDPPGGPPEAGVHPGGAAAPSSHRVHSVEPTAGSNADATFDDIWGAGEAAQPPARHVPPDRTPDREVPTVPDPIPAVRQSTDSASSDSASSDSASSDSASSDSASSDSASSDSALTDSASTDSVSTDSVSTDSASTDSAGSDTAASPAPIARERTASIARSLRCGAVLAVAPLVALLQATDPLDVWLHAWLLATIEGPLPSTLTAVLPIPADGDLRRLRADYPALLHALADAGAASVTFDLAFTAPDDADVAFAEAVDAVRARGVGVFAAGRWRDGQLHGPQTPELAAALELGVAVLETEGWQTVQLGRVPGHVWSAVDQRDEWALSVRTVQSWTPRLAGPSYNDREELLVVAGRALSAPSGRFLLHPVAPPPELSMFEPDSWPPLAGRAVVVGALDHQDRFLTRTGVAHGVYLQAAAIETLAAGRAPRRMHVGVEVLVAFVASVGTFFVGRRSRYGVVGLGATAACVAWIVAQAQAGGMVALAPVLLAGVLAVWAARRWPADAAQSPSPRKM